MRRRFWKGLHTVVNDLAWRFARPPRPAFGSALRIDQRHPLWRLNSWLARRWVSRWMEDRWK